MLGKIWRTVKAIGEFFVTLFNIVKFLIESIINFFVLIGKGVAYIFGIIGFLPASILTIFSAIIIVLIIKKVVNR